MDSDGNWGQGILESFAFKWVIMSDNRDDRDNSSNFKMGKMESDITFIKETLVRMEQSLVRYGERTGSLESDMGIMRTDIATHKTRDEAMAEQVKDLRNSRWWFITSIGGIILAYVWDLMRRLGR